MKAARMKLGIDAVSVDCDRDKTAYRLLDWARSYLDQGVAHRLQYLVRMAVAGFATERNAKMPSPVRANLAWTLLSWGYERSPRFSCSSVQFARSQRSVR
jgi:hypothetical protein